LPQLLTFDSHQQERAAKTGFPQQHHKLLAPKTRDVVDGPDFGLDG
jgi:hypothetical protein